jgi:hypothetical protein
VTRIVERLEDYRTLLALLLAKDASPVLLARYRGTELINCTREGCHRAVIVTAPQDVVIMLELVDDDGWSMVEGLWRCPAEPYPAHRHDDAPVP